MLEGPVGAVVVVGSAGAAVVFVDEASIVVAGATDVLAIAVGSFVAPVTADLVLSDPHPATSAIEVAISATDTLARRTGW
jgi:hypothetical protein